MTNRTTRYQPARDDNGIYNPQPLLEAWCRNNMKSSEVKLSPADRVTTENAIREHCQVRGWKVLAVNIRSNHAHLVIAANAPPKTVRDQLKANCTRALRQQPVPLIAEKTWATGGDIEFIYDENDLERVICYVVEAQD